jgi:hypothetical protein
MHIDGPETDHAILRGYRSDIERLLDQPSDHDARPCPGCTLTCQTCGSNSCVCNCSYTCDDAPRMLSSDPDELRHRGQIAPSEFLDQSNTQDVAAAKGLLIPLR